MEPEPLSCEVATLIVAPSFQILTYGIARRFGHMIKHIYATGHLQLLCQSVAFN